jgi:hypothetical protein
VLVELDVHIGVGEYAIAHFGAEVYLNRALLLPQKPHYFFSVFAIKL